MNIADGNALIEILLGNAAADDVMQRADVSGDGEVSIADVNALIGIILRAA